MQNGPPAPWGICEADIKREETIEISTHLNAYVLAPLPPPKVHNRSRVNAKTKTRNKFENTKLYYYKEQVHHHPPP